MMMMMMMMMMEELSSPATPVYCYQTTRRHIAQYTFKSEHLPVDREPHTLSTINNEFLKLHAKLQNVLPTELSAHRRLIQPIKC
jgi:hypothetical protein